MEEPFEQIKLPGTLWIKCDVWVDYDCADGPVFNKSVITGVEQLGFIVSHQYKIEPSVAQWKRTTCARKECETAFQYEFDLQFKIYDVIGLGFGLGMGTGTLGITMPMNTYVKSFVTRCICCDADYRTWSPEETNQSRLRRVPSTLRFGGLGAVVGVAAASIPLGYLIWTWENPFSRVALAFAGSFAVISGLVAWVRHHFGRRVVRSKVPSQYS
jgi:hypothetical protein